jgi:hypothetical protein
MKLTQLTKPQWDAALNAARVLSSCNPNVAADRARFREASGAFAELLPDGTDERDLITQAMHWDSLNTFALTFAGLPHQIQGDAR